MIDFESARHRARELQAAGRLSEAIPQQIDIINTVVRSGALVPPEDYHRLGIMFFAVQDFPAAVTAFEAARQARPDYPGVKLNLGLSLLRCGRCAEGLAALEQAAPEHPESTDLLDGLADGYGKIGDTARGREFGEKSLLEKERRARPAPVGFALPVHNPPPLRLDHSEENVISFSLFGDRERYLRGAVKNVVAAAAVYPGWRCRFYVDDSVPQQVRTTLAEHGADVRMMPRPGRPADALFWRFLVADDPKVVRFLIRDCDSVVNIRERRAVDEWTASREFFHVMRDHPAHTDLMLAGMWGGIAGLLPPLPRLAEGFSYNPLTESRTVDQQFLGRIVWPMIKPRCLVHDRVYRLFNAREFPPQSELPPGRHVGENDAAVSAR